MFTHSPSRPSLSEADWLNTDHGVHIVTGYCEAFGDVPPAYWLLVEASTPDAVPGMGCSL